MQNCKSLSAQFLVHEISSTFQVADDDCPVASDSRTDFAASEELDANAEHLVCRHLMGARADCIARSPIPANVDIVLVDLPAATIIPELIVFFAILTVSWGNAVAQILA